MGPSFSRSSGRRIHWRGVLAALLVLSTLLAPSRLTSAQSPAEAYYIEETGHSLGGPFLTYWMENGGLSTLGMPVSEPASAPSGERQYFEFGVLDRAETGDEITVGPAGSELLELRHDPLNSAAGKRSGAERVAGAFAGIGDATGVILEPTASIAIAPEWTDKLNAIYDAAGGVERFGRPVSDVHVAMGKVVRWFEDGRIETWSTPDAEAEMAPVGMELALLSGVDTDEIAAGDLLSISGVALAAGDTGGTQVASVEGALESAEGAVESADTSGGFADASGAFSPTRISIPAIGVDAPIEQVGIYDGVMGTPAGPMNVGWYPAISSPGTGSNVVMAGHVDYYTIGPAVFYSLASLGAGSEIYVTGPNGEGITYAVTGSTVVGADTPAENVLGGPGGESLTLITCSGGFNGVAYDSRTIVYASRI